MNGSTKIEHAFSKKGTRSVPVVIPYEDLLHRDHWEQLTKAPWWVLFEPDLVKHVRYRTECLRKTGTDWYRVYPFFSKQERGDMRIERSGRKAMLVNTKTGKATELSRPPVSGTAFGHELRKGPSDRAVDTARKIDQVISEPKPFCKTDFLAQGKADLAHALDQALQGALWPFGQVGSPLWYCYQLWGFEETLIHTLKNPSLVEYAAHQYLQHRLVDVDRLAALGAKGIFIEECFTDLISPEAFERINVPLMKKLIDRIRSHNMKSVYYYCGNPWQRLDALLNCGADGYAFEEGKKDFSIDVVRIAEKMAGRATLFGNLDSVYVLEFSDEKAMEAEVARQLAALSINQGRFVMSLGSPVTPNTPVSRVRAFTDCVRRLGSFC